MDSITQFIHQTHFDDLPEAVIHQSKRCLIDLVGVAVAGHETRLTTIMEAFVLSQYPGDIPLLFSQNTMGTSSQKTASTFNNKTASVLGASLFGAMLIDSIDAHDGQVLTKGHVGVAILPAILALSHNKKITGQQFLTALVIGYEVATRAGIALHKTALDYHTSGAWNSIGVAAAGAYLEGLSREQSLEALGIAEFYGPRSQMMRCIDHPTMLKDGSGWGALAGTSAVLLAQSGFTGAPAISVVNDDVSSIWQDLGKRWYILEQYFKAYPVCRWAQPAVEAALSLKDKYHIAAEEIVNIEVYSFHQAKRLHVVHPASTEQAQYSLPFSVASALIDGTITAASVAETEQGIFNPMRRSIAEKITCRELESYNSVFPEERWAHVVITLACGQVVTSKPHIARGNPENPLSDAEIQEKFLSLTSDKLSQNHQKTLIESCLRLENTSPEELSAFFKQLS